MRCATNPYLWHVVYYKGLLYEYCRIMPKSLIRHPLAGHSMVSDFMLSSFLLLVFHMKKKLYHGISVLFKIDQSGLVGFFVCLFF